MLQTTKQPRKYKEDFISRLDSGEFYEAELPPRRVLSARIGSYSETALMLLSGEPFCEQWATLCLAHRQGTAALSLGRCIAFSIKQSSSHLASLLLTAERPASQWQSSGWQLWLLNNPEQCAAQQERVTRLRQ